MKIRNDFVTNSSSSSFVISRKDTELNSVDSLYKYIRNLYIIYRDNIKDVIAYAMNDKRILIKMNEKTGLPHYITHNDQSLKGFSAEYKRLDNKLKKKFNLSFFDTLDFNTAWLSCETYEEYEKFIESLFNVFYSKESCKIFGIVIREDYLNEKFKNKCIESFTINNKNSKHLTSTTNHINKEKLYIFIK